jgi:hypothetical protein
MRHLHAHPAHPFSRTFTGCRRMEALMSVLESDGRRTSDTVLCYAPRRHRRSAEQASILPILERLPRGQSDERPAASLQKAPRIGAVPPPPSIPAAWGDSFSIAIRLAIAASAIAGFAIFGGYLLEAKQQDRLADASSDTQKTVRTVSFKPMTGQAKAQISVASTEPSLPPVAETIGVADGNDRAAVDSDPPVASEIAGGSEITKPWAFIPIETTAGWQDPAQLPKGSAEAAANEVVPEPAAASSDHKAIAVRRAHRRHYWHHRQRAASAASPSSADPAVSLASTPTATAQPVEPPPQSAAEPPPTPAPGPESPLGSALRSLFTGKQ